MFTYLVQVHADNPGKVAPFIVEARSSSELVGVLSKRSIMKRVIADTFKKYSSLADREVVMLDEAFSDSLSPDLSWNEKKCIYTKYVDNLTSKQCESWMQRQMESGYFICVRTAPPRSIKSLRKLN